MKPRKSPSKKSRYTGAGLKNAEAEMNRLADAARAAKKAIKQAKKKFKQAKRAAKQARKTFEALKSDVRKAPRRKRAKQKAAPALPPPDGGT